MTPEGKVKASVKKLLAKYKVWYYMPVGGLLGRSGVPDFLILINGQFIGVETKAGNNKPTALQNLEMEKIRNAGGVALVVNENNLVDLEKILDVADREKHSSVSR